MPVKRSASRATLRLADLTFHEKFAILSSWWRAGTTVGGAKDFRFKTWPEFFATYALVRDELRAVRPSYWPPWAEVARPIFQADPARFDPDAASEAYDAARTAGAIRAQSGGKVAVS